MALQKTISTKYGVSGNYLRIIQIDIKAKYGFADIRVDVYKDKAARDAKLMPLESFLEQIKGEGFVKLASSKTGGETLFNEIATKCYEYLKTLKKFEGSLDV